MMLNDLYDYDLKIYQNPEYFKFSIDSLLLAEFVHVKKGDKNIIDLCTGNAPIPMILSRKYGEKIKIVGVELQREIYDLGIKSLEYNQIKNVCLHNLDILNILSLYNAHSFDIVTCNPPYFKNYPHTNINDNPIKALARHEIAINLEDVIKVSSSLLKNGGYLYLVHEPVRLAEIIILLNKYGFGLKQVQMVYDDLHTPCCLILIEAIYNGADYVKINRPLYLKQHTTYQNIFNDR